MQLNGARAYQILIGLKQMAPKTLTFHGHGAVAGGVKSTERFRKGDLPEPTIGSHFQPVVRNMSSKWSVIRRLCPWLL